ncbi:uncharacterized protein LOC132949922 isoform X2 [Metopolophium dirhodum]|uniref:uncharacterized protein LOC132935064 isoform X2 n=1 Tax=Metopolophium dirhodum TaxID=44670 RepID=UPI0029900C8A|nr:uncharacterized protein LOC132935064 isoform X2 [Metopolophium dirhodum]XP_060857538.1 uncharacterized protein LOC132935096 isoform X2 [Metopolophium dirhodum]XP_060857593.1 uncharacterized protein LOC132935144 isoform X2 [Metopolophium dirhodum]XP_060862001.1 uncharacterized protein LOC132939020 isoform X2 [Metopolophium dirhodum]XP_060863260.1 uncharacterized protein LOC132939871 isoform X2 [Metopolophium dirhodum]XP_060877030.1 uncharacterized protein LOC132949922 isoform X2 [Metopolophi
MEVYEDVGELYCEYVKNNEDDTMTELDFFKSAFKDAMIEIDNLRQQYHNLNEQFNNKKVESSYYAEDVIQLQTDNKSLTEELAILKTKNEILEEDNSAIKTKNDSLEKEIKLFKQKMATIEVKDKAEHYEEKKKEQQNVHSLISSAKNMNNYVKRDDLLPIESKVSFIEKLVCSKMDRLKLQDETSSLINVIDDTLKTNYNCTEWWCPKHSKFLEILNGIKIGEQTVEDKYIIRKAKSRFAYWDDKNNKNTPRCPTQDRKRGEVIHYQKPKCWP